MRDFSTGHRKSPAGFDRVLMAVTATFLSLAATSAIAQNAPAKSPADLAIDAAVPLPEPANVPPPTAADFKLPEPAAPATDSVAKAPDAAPATTATVTPPAQAPAPASAPAPETAAAPASTAPAVAAADQPVADKLRDLIATKGARYFDRKAERAAVENFYKDRNYAPLWSEGGNATARAKSVIARLKNADSDGLSAADYPTPDFSASAGPDALADSELKLTESMLDYARHAQSGRMHWSRVSGDISYPEHPIDPVEVLINVSTALDAAAALDSYNPTHKGYLALKAKLAALRGVTEDTSKQIAEGDTLKFVKPTKKNPNPAVAEDERVALAQELANTRSAAALELWRPHLQGAVVAIGNAPTALFHLLDMIDAGAPRPAAILGIPVGFIGAAESKDALAARTDLEHLVVRGRRGGSAITAAALNALASEQE